jgi:hypothetical protein
MTTTAVLLVDVVLEIGGCDRCSRWNGIRAAIHARLKLVRASAPGARTPPEGEPLRRRVDAGARRPRSPGSRPKIGDVSPSHIGGPTPARWEPSFTVGTDAEWAVGRR